MSRFIATAAAIAQRGWTVLTDFLRLEVIAELRDEARQFWQEEEFRAAGIGRSGGYAVRSGIRSDHIRWLDDQAPTPAQKLYWEAIEELRQTLNRELFLGLACFEAHFAIYPPGAFYQKHLDRFSDADERVISCTLYLNEAWQTEDGGQLRLYFPDGHQDVLPTAGTCALFRSDTFFHEVWPATKARFSLTGWLRRRSLRLV